MLEPGPCCSLHIFAWRQVTKSPSGWRTLLGAVGCLSTSLSGSRSNWLNPFGFPISCRQILARFRTLPTALHRDHTPELALGTPVPTRRAAAQAFEAWGASPFSRMSLLFRPQPPDCRFFPPGLQAPYPPYLPSSYPRHPPHVV